MAQTTNKLGWRCRLSKRWGWKAPFPLAVPTAGTACSHAWSACEAPVTVSLRRAGITGVDRDNTRDRHWLGGQLPRMRLSSPLVLMEGLPAWRRCKPVRTLAAARNRLHQVAANFPQMVAHQRRRQLRVAVFDRVDQRIMLGETVMVEVRCQFVGP